MDRTAVKSLSKLHVSSSTSTSIKYGYAKKLRVVDYMSNGY